MIIGTPRESHLRFYDNAALQIYDLLTAGIDHDRPIGAHQANPHHLRSDAYPRLRSGPAANWSCYPSPQASGEAVHVASASIDLICGGRTSGNRVTPEADQAVEMFAIPLQNVDRTILGDTTAIHHHARGEMSSASRRARPRPASASAHRADAAPHARR
jgi:hypothetical protein